MSFKMAGNHTKLRGVTDRSEVLLLILRSRLENWADRNQMKFKIIKFNKTFTWRGTLYTGLSWLGTSNWKVAWQKEGPEDAFRHTN